jgi:hypothetical protein
MLGLGQDMLRNMGGRGRMAGNRGNSASQYCEYARNRTAYMLFASELIGVVRGNGARPLSHPILHHPQQRALQSAPLQ